jgi:hypothetical protein
MELRRLMLSILSSGRAEKRDFFGAMTFRVDAFDPAIMPSRA